MCAGRPVGAGRTDKVRRLKSETGPSTIGIGPLGPWLLIAKSRGMCNRDLTRVAAMRANRDTGPVTRTLDHLPPPKRRELDHIVSVLRDEFARACASRWSSPLKAGAILKIILFGSYARGDWVEDPVGRYFSDYDLLIVVADERHADVSEFWEGAERKLEAALVEGRELRTPVQVIVHSFPDVADQLARGRYFFIDIVRDGVVLFEEPSHPLKLPEPLAVDAALAEARAHYAHWIPGASRRLRLGELAIGEGMLNEAAFELHQAAEQLYNGLLLVVTLYTPKSHNLVRLRGLAEGIAPELAEVWPRRSKFERRCFELLRAAYVKARYSPKFEVTADELAWMRERVELLRTRVVAICEAQLATMGSRER